METKRYNGYLVVRRAEDSDESPGEERERMHNSCIRANTGSLRDGRATRGVRGKNVCRVFPVKLMVVLERRSKTSSMSLREQSCRPLLAKRARQSRAKRTPGGWVTSLVLAFPSLP